MLKNLVENKHITTNEQGLVYLQGLIYISKCIRSKVIARHYDNLMYSYIGTKKTAKAILRNYYFLNMRRKVQGYIY
jgi:hypothetical protein